ncbi:hypothetical protein G9A89_009928 [Geosiphon pyriformis]|nr:hypothetical protein G9A89_009928 [Geosiphon pyriformis]
MSSKRKTVEGEASTFAVVGADSTIENKRKKIDENQDFIITDVNTCDASNPSRIPLKSELTQGKVDLVRVLFFGESFIVIYKKIAFLGLDFHVGESAQEVVDKEKLKTPEGLDIIETNRIAGQDFLLLTKEELMRYGLKGGPATRIALLVEKLKGEEQDSNLYFQTKEMLNTKPPYIIGKSDLFTWLQRPPMKPIQVYPSLYEQFFMGRLPSDYLNKNFLTYSYLYLEGEQVVRKDSFTCELNELEGRIKAFIIGVNMGRLLPLLCQTVPQYFQREFVILPQSNGKVVGLMQNVVVKRYRSTQSLEHVNEDETGAPFVILSPKGMVYKPESKKQLIKALCCVLTALKALHKIKIMHRDIRWENVLKLIDRDKWLIIDFDDAFYTTSAASGAHFAEENHAPEIFQDGYNESVDIWSVEYLILTASVQLQEFDELKVYARKLSARNKLDRPTAEEALQWLWSEYYDILREEF